MASPRRFDEQKQEYRRDITRGDMSLYRTPPALDNYGDKERESVFVTILVIELQAHLQLSR